MKRAYVPKYVVGGLAAVVLAGLLVWLIRSEGERTRRMIRDARPSVESGPKVISPGPSEHGAHVADPSTPASDAHQTAIPASEPSQQKPGTAMLAEPKPAVAKSTTRADDDFSLDDYIVFPGLADEVSRKRRKPREEPPVRDQEN